MTWSKVRYPELLSLKVPAGFNAKLDELAYQNRELRAEFARRMIMLGIERAKAEQRW